MGLKTRLAQDWEAGVFVGMGLNRDSGDADRLKGLDDIDYHATYGAFVEWRPGPYALGLAYRQAAHKGYGGVMELRATYLAWRDDSNALRVGVNAEWANGDAMQTWYGVTPGQAARSRSARLFPVFGLPVGVAVCRLVASVVRALEHGRHAGRIDGAGRRPRQPAGRAR